MAKAIAVYVRVSTGTQDVRSQEPDLRAWLKSQGRGAAVTWYHDTFTGRTFNRPGMVKLEENIKTGKIGTLVVWRLDRLGRTAGETITFLDRLNDAGVRFVSLRDGGHELGVRPSTQDDSRGIRRVRTRGDFGTDQGRGHAGAR